MFSLGSRSCAQRGATERDLKAHGTKKKSVKAEIRSVFSVLSNVFCCGRKRLHLFNSTCFIPSTINCYLELKQSIV